MTGQHATEVRENALGLGQAVEELRHAVIRVVRTSTAEVDRREHARQPVDLACRLTAEGQTHAVRIVDLSNAGAQVRGAPALQAGLRGALAIEGAGSMLAFTVTHFQDGVLGVAFAADAVTSAACRQLLDRVKRPLAA